jgi:hypothetical protein
MQKTKETKLKKNNLKSNQRKEVQINFKKLTDDY